MNLISLKNKLLVNPLTMWFNPLTIVKPPQNLLTWLMPPLALTCTPAGSDPRALS